MSDRAYTITRPDLIAILIRHQRHSSEACLCGWSELGRSHAAHIADQVERLQ